MAYKIIEKSIMSDGTEIQLEDWSEENTPEFHDLHGLTIAAYPKAKNTSRHGWIRGGKEFRLNISKNSYSGYTNEMVKEDYEALKNGTKTLIDLQEHYWNGDKDKYYIGILEKESV